MQRHRPCQVPEEFAAQGHGWSRACYAVPVAGVRSRAGGVIKQTLLQHVASLLLCEESEEGGSALIVFLSSGTNGVRAVCSVGLNRKLPAERERSGHALHSRLTSVSFAVTHVSIALMKSVC